MKWRNLCLLAAAVFMLAACTGEKEPVVQYKLYKDWVERQLPDFSQLGEPDMQGIKNNLDLVDLPDTINHFAVLFETTLPVRKAEEYTFKISSDDGSRFYIDGELLIENDGAHGPILKTATKQLSKGTHALRLEFFDFDKGQSLDFRYSTPTIPEQELNPWLEKREFEKASDDSFVGPQVEEALQRYLAWKGDDETVCFPVLTDVHTADRYSYLHIGYGAVAAEKFGADFMANLGDIGLNAYPATVDAAYAKTVVDNTQAQMLKYDGVWLYTAGNHDWDAGEGQFLTEQFLTDTFHKLCELRDGLHIVRQRERALQHDLSLHLFIVDGQHRQVVALLGITHKLFHGARHLINEFLYTFILLIGLSQYLHALLAKLLEVGIFCLGESIRIEEDDTMWFDDCFLSFKLMIGHDAQWYIRHHRQRMNILSRGIRSSGGASILNDQRSIMASVAIAQTARRQVENTEEQRYEHHRLVRIRHRLVHQVHDACRIGFVGRERAEQRLCDGHHQRCRHGFS